MLKKKIYPAYVSKHNSNRKQQVTLLMVSNVGKLRHYLAAKSNPHYYQEQLLNIMGIVIARIAFILSQQKKA